MPCRVLVAVLSVSLFAASSAAFATPTLVEVTACGQDVHSGQIGYLSADLECPVASGSIAVKLGNDAKLDLRGFTLSGGIVGVGCGAIQCQGTWCGPNKGGRCEVFGGTITGTGYEAVGGADVTVRNMTIVDNPVYAILAFRKATGIDSHFDHSLNGVQANNVIHIQGSTLIDADVVSGGKVKVESSSVTGNRVLGVYGDRAVRLIGSSVTGNGTEYNCGQPNEACADVGSRKRPHVDAASTCGTSLVMPTTPGVPTASWGVCSLD